MRYPVSFGQRRLWFMDQLNPGEPTFNMPYLLSLDGPLDAGVLQRALDAMVVRHPVLRTSITAVGGLPEQVVADTGSIPIELIELDEAAPDLDRQVEQLTVTRAMAPFQLDQAPLLRVSLIRTGPQRRLLMLVMHHIISDGASMGVLIHDLAAAYRAEAAGQPIDLAPLWMDYGDYAIWQRDRLQGEELDRQLDYWRGQLRGAPTMLTLPTDRPRPVQQSSRGAVAVAQLAPELTRQLTDLAVASNATRFMVFLAGFAVVLSRYARQRDLLIGTPVSGRTHVELDPIVGLFTNTVCVRVRLPGELSFRELLGQLRDSTLDVLAHQELPFENLVAEFAPERSLAHAPLIQVQFGYQSLIPPELELPGIRSSGRAVFTRTAKLDFGLFADTMPDDRTTLVAEYSTDLFDAAWAERFLGCLISVLGAAAGGPDSPVIDLPLLSPAESAELTGQQLAPPAPLEPLDLRAALAASESRVSDGTEAVPMAEVCRRAGRIARVLAEHGVGPETPVGLCQHRGIGLLSSLLGVWWAGGAYVPLDPDFPPARLSAMVRGAGLSLVLCDEATLGLADSLADTIQPIRVDDPGLAGVHPLPPVPLPDGALAYQIFTSGSTGQPKGVGVEHRAVANLLGSFQRLLGLGPDDRFVAVTTLSFDIALLELLLPPLCGADLVIATAAETREPDLLHALIERTGATAMQATPQTWRLLLAAGGVPPGLRLRLCGGEALPRDLADQLDSAASVLWNLYGPTETTVWSAAGTVERAPGPVPVGPPIERTRVYLLDERLNPVPRGVVGQVFLAGDGVARGYLGRPRLTGQAFRPDPWSDRPGQRMYATGDLGRWTDSGGLQLIGRTDHQVKLRGYRVECGEVEAALRSHREIRQAAVLPADRAGTPVLVGYVVRRRPSARPAGDPADPALERAELLDLLRPHLRSMLPEYMIPDLIVALPTLPLTPNGKVDRAGLPAPDWGKVSSAAARLEPANPVEATLAGIWGDLVASPQAFGMDDNLFSVGGNSLTATRFVSRVTDTYRVQLPVHQIFATPTIGELARIVSAELDAAEFDSSNGTSSELDELSDEELDALLRAALAQRNRRRAHPSDPES
jgi:amino acid adenylation domain-containing protein